MAGAETKHRKPSPATRADTGDGSGADADGGGKARGRARGAQAGLARRAALALRRRRWDLVGVSIYAAIVVVGYWVADTRLLQPPEAAGVRILRPLGLLLFACFKLSWLGIVWHGPGVPPQAPPPEPLPAAWKAFFGAGRVCRARPFGADEGPCDRCGTDWKPILVHHCSQCDRCGLWMDHHCHFAARCVGFRNHRCFLTWIFYGICLIGLLIVFTAYHAVAVGLPDTRCGWGAGALWLGYMVSLGLLLRQHLTMALLRVATGWPSQVLMHKFKALNRDAKLLVTELSKAQGSLHVGDPQRMAAQAMIEKIKRAGAQVTRGGGGRLGNSLRGPFRADDFRASLTFLFGDPVMWHWLLPFVPGGSGDPLRPASYCKDACEAWANLGDVMEGGHQVIAKVHQASREWSQCVREIVGRDIIVGGMGP